MGKLIMNGVVYGGGSGGAGGSSVYSEKVLWQDASGYTSNTNASVTLTDSLLNYDAIVIEVSRESDYNFRNQEFVLASMIDKTGIKWFPFDMIGSSTDCVATCRYVDETHLILGHWTYLKPVKYYKIVGLKFGTLSPIIYSEEEREVGVWIDGKPLYQKSFTLASQLTVSASSWTNTNLTLSDVEKFINGYAISDDGTFQGSVVVDKSNNVIQLQSTRKLASYVKYLTVFYTKTTDIPGSGKWASTGVPTVHYSADWHVVGTWWNGKPIYEKTFHFTTENLPADRATIEKIYDFDELVGIDGYFGYQHYSNDFRNYKLGEAPPQLTNQAIYLLCEGNDQVSDIQDLDFNFNGLDRSKVVYISATVRITKTTD